MTEMMWGVRWSEIGFPPRIQKCNGEQDARDFHRYLTSRYQELGRDDRPELLAAKIVWKIQAP